MQSLSVREVVRLTTDPDEPAQSDTPKCDVVEHGRTSSDDRST